MHLFVTSLGVSTLLVLTASSAGMPAPATADAYPHPDRACVVSARFASGPEPPAWLLLAGAVVLLGAGRVAAPPSGAARFQRSMSMCMMPSSSYGGETVSKPKLA